eukprot:GILK01001408.1.p1 GENE.GILK01001408.1~~GILK01001408.1.p1  ORF type:complete len:595 (-),score=104.03 GILK01001408.1:1181-2929(-)
MSSLASSSSSAEGPWLPAWYDPLAGLKCFSSCIRLTDLYGDGDHKLIIADLERKMRIYKGTQVIWESVLLGVPVAVASFYPDMRRAGVPTAPALAVASGPYIFIYRNLRPYFKFTLPQVDIHPSEQEVWSALKEDKIDTGRAFEKLSAARDSGVVLSSRSADLLSLEDSVAQQQFIQGVKTLPLVQQTVITAMEVLKKNMEDETAVSMLVVATESKRVMILDPSSTSITVSVEVGGVPAFMAVSGLFDIEYRIVVATRDGRLYTIKNGEKLGTVIELETHPCGLVKTEKCIFVATVDNVIHSYHFKGKKNYSIYLPHSISNMELLSLSKTRTVRCLLVALSNGEVRLYNEKHLITTLHTNDVVTGMRFGPYGREEGSLILTCKSGSLTVKMLQRQANLENSTQSAGPPPEQDVPLNIPKKTKLYVEQTQREREQAADMHRIFQRDLIKLRLNTARTYVKVLLDGHGPMSTTSGTQLRLNAMIQGLGPLFKLRLHLQNAGMKQLQDLPVTFTYNQELYRIRNNFFNVPVLVPGLLYTYEVEVESIDPNGSADSIRVFICNSKSALPLLSAIVNMPMSEQRLPD